MSADGHISLDGSRRLSLSRSPASKDGESPGTSRAQRHPSAARRKRTRTPRPPTDLADGELSEEEFLNEWGITKDQEEIKLKAFRAGLEAELGPLKPVFDRYYLRRFLRARQHDLHRATDMFKAHLKWRGEFGTDTIIEDYHFHERDAFLTLYPQGYHKTDRLGRPIYIQHLGQINVRALQDVTTVDRMLRFHVQEYERALRYIFPACSLVAGRHVSQTLAIMDLRGVGLRHLTGEVKAILSAFTSTDQNNYPETLGKTLIINAPAVFRAIWAIVKPMLDTRTQAKIEVCPADYMKVLTKWVDPENIPQYLGGRSLGSLIDDVGPWNDPSLVAEIDSQRAKAEGRVAGESPLASRGTSPMAQYASSTPLAFKPRGGALTTTSEPLLSGAAAEDVASDSELYQDALARRLSSSSTMSAYLSADEGGDFVSSSEGHGIDGTGAAGRRLRLPGEIGTSDGESVVGTPGAQRAGAAKAGMPSPPAQISILARVRALEERLPEVERPIRSQFHGREELPSRTIGQGTLFGRVVALEKAMDTLLRAQQTAMDQQAASKAGSGCCAGCTLM